MSRATTKLFMRALMEEYNEEPRIHFHILGRRGKHNYTSQQKDFALSLVDNYGVRATARVLLLPKRTIQRWCRQYGKRAKRCPAWVYEWAERRRKRREFWQRRGYF